MKDLAIVYMVAGISSRFGGKIKQFAKIGKSGETLIECSLNQALAAGFNKIVFIVGNRTEQPFREMFGSEYKGVPVFYASQNYNPNLRDKPWGTADALCSARDVIDGGFVVCNGDDIYGENTFKILFDHLQSSENCATIGYRLGDALPEEGTTNRAIFKIENEYVLGLTEIFNIEKSNLDATGTRADDLCSMNIYALYPPIIDMLKERLKIFKKEHAGDRKIEFLLPNEISKLVGEGMVRMKLYPTTDRWVGVTNPEDEERVREILKNI